VGLIARVLERDGLPTVTMSSAHDITAKVKPPRAAFLNYPLGNSVGSPGDPAGQREVIAAALGLLEAAMEPGVIAELPFRWPDDDWQRKVNALYDDEAAIVHRQRSEGEYDVDPATGERRHYAAQEAEAVARLI
jgi:hypothetical protein